MTRLLRVFAPPKYLQSAREPVLERLVEQEQEPKPEEVWESELAQELARQVLLPARFWEGATLEPRRASDDPVSDPVLAWERVGSWEVVSPEPAWVRSSDALSDAVSDRAWDLGRDAGFHPCASVATWESLWDRGLEALSEKVFPPLASVVAWDLLLRWEKSSVPVWPQPRAIVLASVFAGSWAIRWLPMSPRTSFLGSEERWDPPSRR